MYVCMYQGNQVFNSLCWCCLVTLLVVAVLITVITVTLGRGTTDDGLGTDLVDPTGLCPITAGPLVGPQVAVTGVAFPLRVPGPPQVRLAPWQSDKGMRYWLHRRAKITQNDFKLIRGWSPMDEVLWGIKWGWKWLTSNGSNFARQPSASYTSHWLPKPSQRS